MASQVRFQMLSGICEHIDKTVMAPTTWMPCITHHIYAIDFQLIFSACKWNTCTFAGLQAFVFDLQHHRIGLSWIERTFKEHFSAVILSIHCMIISESVSVCVYASRFWLCVLFQWSLNNVSMQQRSEAISDTSLPLTKHQQNFILSLSLSFSPSLPSPFSSADWQSSRGEVH